MFYVYILRSCSYPEKTYIGRTNDLEKRINIHNSGSSFYTSCYKPWTMEVSVGFAKETKAIEFEKYLKSGSGRAFVQKRLLQLRP